MYEVMRKNEGRRTPSLQQTTAGIMLSITYDLVTVLTSSRTTTVDVEVCTPLTTVLLSIDYP